MVLAMIATAVNASFLVCGLPEFDRSLFGPVSGCEAAMKLYPGLTAQELIQGSGMPAMPGDRVTIWIRATGPGGAVVVDSDRRGFPTTMTIDSGSTWEKALYGMLPGEKRRVTLDYRAAFGSFVGMTLEIRMESVAAAKKLVAQKAQR